ncbi:MAG: molybdenum cofactor guanylyltransferase [Desulfovibrio sp.]|nr:MAG: molybdenum cofactor guanylyltransferase [Desulfovibrio sp.]
MIRFPKGVVLAGGKSTRLGRDKAREAVSGVSLLQRTCDLLSEVVDEVWISGRNPVGMGLNLPWIEDDTPGHGPLGGILTLLARLKQPILVLACDLPFIDRYTLERLLRARAGRKASTVMTTFRQAETGFIESLVAVYEPEAAPFLAAALGKNRNRISGAVPEECRLHITYTQEESDVFFNINHPADLAMLKRIEQLSSVV